jgi:hypothetical protein
MTTNDDIMEESGYYPVLKESDDEMAKVCVRAMLDEARVATAKEIFAELDKMIEELDDSFRMIGEITLDEEEYEALKKKHKVD